MVHERPYSDAKTHEEALEELKHHAGTQFDPQVVDIFCQIYAEQVPPDGLEEVYRLHQKARGGLDRLPVTPDALQAESQAPVPERRRARRSGLRQAAG
jgi:hypothetical protein